MDDFGGHNFAFYEYISAMGLLPVLHNQLLSSILEEQQYQSNIFIAISL